MHCMTINFNCIYDYDNKLLDLTGGSLAQSVERQTLDLKV